MTINEIKGFKVFSLNVRSILSKIDQLRCDFANVSFDVFSFSETWLKPNIDDCLLRINGYNFQLLDRSILNHNGDLKTGGGLICYYCDLFTCTIINEATFCSNDLEILSIKLVRPNHLDVVIVLIYRPPSGCIHIALDKIKELCEGILDTQKHLELYLVGDLNIDLLVNSIHSKSFSEMCAHLSLYSLVNVPTRVTMNTSSIIDICVNNCSSIISLGIVEYNISDHLLLYAIKKHVKSKITKTVTRVRSYKDYDIELLRLSLESYNWGRFYATSVLKNVGKNYLTKY